MCLYYFYFLTNPIIVPNTFNIYYPDTHTNTHTIMLVNRQVCIFIWLLYVQNEYWLLKKIQIECHNLKLPKWRDIYYIRNIGVGLITKLIFCLKKNNSLTFKKLILREKEQIEKKSPYNFWKDIVFNEHELHFILDKVFTSAVFSVILSYNTPAHRGSFWFDFHCLGQAWLRTHKTVEDVDWFFWS